MTSSGYLLEAYDGYASCGAESDDGTVCTFDGEVEYWHDAETNEAWWECPLCHQEHDVFIDDLSDEDWYNS